MINEIKKALKKKSSPKRAKASAWFFKTGKGEYAEGDKFIGITMPDLRKVIKNYLDLPLADLKRLLASSIHEERMAALLIMGKQFEKGSEKTREKIYKAYLASTKHINNWDLVDLSAPHIVGKYLADKKDRKILDQLASSGDLWENRIAMLACAHFIARQNDYQDALKIANKLVNHKHDLIHKAVGWMLREIGKRDLVVEEKFLKQHYKTMPRTMLRYAIEKFPKPKRRGYLAGTIN